MVLQCILHLIYQFVNQENSFVTENHQMRSCMKKCHLFKYLNAIMLHKVSMLGTKMFEYLNISLQDIKAMPKVFGGISLILSGDLLQLLAI